MRYQSTRGQAPELGFEDVLLTGLARDGGLYVPVSWPQLSAEQLRGFQNASYQEIAVEVMAPFVDDAIDRPTLARLVNEAYGRFHHPAIAPLKQIDQQIWTMELFHGPTLAFKDFALQLLGLLFDHVLTKRQERVTIVGATSGDTGSAAIEACRDRSAIDIFILHPEGRVSEVQRRQMTTVPSANVHNIALAGSFDDCQDMVKALFNDLAFRDEMHLSAVNSINWARIMAQIVYYVVAAIRLGAPDRIVHIAVPTGNFGNIFAAYAAKQMGVPLGILGVGSNRNDILTRFFEHNDMRMMPVEPSYAPSMDIQVSSNFERLLFDLLDREGLAVEQVMRSFRESGTMAVSQGVWQQAQAQFRGFSLDNDQTLAAMQGYYQSTGELFDPHSVVGVAQAQQQLISLTQETQQPGPIVTMATAHPAKFPDAVEKATGVRPALPSFLSDLYEREERCKALPNDYDGVKSYIKQNVGR